MRLVRPADAPAPVNGGLVWRKVPDACEPCPPAQGGGWLMAADRERLIAVQLGQRVRLAEEQRRLIEEANSITKRRPEDDEED